MIKAPKRTVLIALSLAGLSGCDHPHEHHHVITAKVIDTIKAAEVRGANDVSSGDPNKVLAHFTADAVIMIPGRAPIVGAAALREAVSNDLQGPRDDLTFASDKVEAPHSGEIAASRGTYKLTAPDPAKSSAGSYVAVYRPAVDGRWLIAWLIAAPGAPQPPPPAHGD
jgi:ketosteroid isomerase-like protein